uniref:Uncharacterized protein n=1 Tax=Myoviridae sp. ctYzH9 TaxID=2825126 RepID=A0A8S5Q3T2_9CAUD|nr:MAG TPA: hypothetical protein [Myoviridae sp. ctYzH9]
MNDSWTVFGTCLNGRKPFSRFASSKNGQF